jgi:hypothetical protein
MSEKPPILNRTEYDMLKKISRLISSLLLASLVLGSSLVTSYLVYTFEIAHSALLKISTALAGLIVIACSCILLSRGGAKSHYMYMKVLSFGMYLFAILCLYSCSALTYFMVNETRHPKKATNLHAFQASTIIGLLCGLVIIYATTQIPLMLRFLKEFKVFEKKVFLLEFLFPPKYVPRKKIVISVDPGSVSPISGDGEKDPLIKV